MSACESLLDYFEGHPYSRRVGENTAGMLHFGNEGFVLLPNSQISVQMATDFWKYKDGRFVERIGYAPHFRVEPGQDALNVALELLRQDP